MLIFLGSILDIDFAFDVFHGSTVVPHDVGAVAVIDGSKFSHTQMKDISNYSRDIEIDSPAAGCSAATHGTQ